MKQIRKFTLTAMFLAILILLASTPLGFIPIGPVYATTMHIPVIIASIVLGPKIGGFLGGVFGIISMIRSTVIITPLSFLFSPFINLPGLSHGSWKAVLVAIIPRILIGIIPYFVYKGCQYWLKERYSSASLFVSGLAGSMVNTIVVMSCIYFLFKPEYAQVLAVQESMIYKVILGIILTSGLPEALVAGILVTAISNILLRLLTMRKSG